MTALPAGYPGSPSAPGSHERNERAPGGRVNVAGNSAGHDSAAEARSGVEQSVISPLRSRLLLFLSELIAGTILIVAAWRGRR